MTIGRIRIHADYGEGLVPTDHVWTIDEWCAETRSMDQILDDCNEYYVIRDGEEIRCEHAIQLFYLEL